jgi:hypothetical protein
MTNAKELHHIPPVVSYLDVVVGLVCTNDPESYAGGA